MTGPRVSGYLLLPVLLSLLVLQNAPGTPGTGSFLPAATASTPEEKAGPAHEVRDGRPAEFLEAAPPGDTEAGRDAPDPWAQTLRSEILDLLPVSRWRGSEWGVLAVSLDRGDTLASYNPRLPLTPASNIKLMTTAAALHHLGPDFRFSTFLLADGPVENGVLRGDLIIYGTGDPTLSERFQPTGSQVLRAFARSAAEAGIQEVEGDVVADASFFSGTHRPQDWATGYQNDWFAAPAPAISFNENVVLLRIAPGRFPGLPPVIRTEPEGVEIPVENVARTVEGPRRSGLFAVRDRVEDPIRIQGEMGRHQPEIWRRITVADPPSMTAILLRRAMEEEGIRVRGSSRALEEEGSSSLTGRLLWAPAFHDADGARVLARHDSPPLREILTVINKRSHNLYAEAVLRILGRIVTGDGSFEGGTDVVRRFLVEVVGVPEEDLEVKDGSGLASSNRATPHAFVLLLSHLSSTPLWNEFRETLPEAGNRRELSRMHQTPAAGNLRAKTGTISRTSALSGIVTTVGGERVVFSILANQVPSTSGAKRIEDAVGAHLASFDRALTDPPAEVEPSPAAGTFTSVEEEAEEEEELF